MVTEDEGEVSVTATVNEAGSPTSAWTENRPASGWSGLDLRELLARRELVWFLALRDLKVRYKQAVFGVAWAVLQPLFGMVVLTVVFSLFARLPSDGTPYPVFAYLGYSVWAYVSGTIGATVYSLVNNAGLVTKVYFPRIAVPLAATLPGLVDLACAWLFLLPLMLLYGVVPGVALLAVPVGLAIMYATVLGVGLLLGAANVRYRDVGRALPLVLQLWMFLSPVAYAASLVPERWSLLYALNPLAGALSALRWSMLGGAAPGWSLALSSMSALILLVSGLRYFARSSRDFADVI